MKAYIEFLRVPAMSAGIYVIAGFSPSWLRGVFVSTYPNLKAGANVSYDDRNPERYFNPPRF
ncbi:MAG: hypothetical protein HYX73_00985 [Acidobacteria bacterium]|nr:hypothetical protein [Acidobacteriota bacterium]